MARQHSKADQDLHRPSSDELEELFCAALVDDDGREIPITQDMIKDACDALIEADPQANH